jgi:hypothetical protein
MNESNETPKVCEICQTPKLEGCARGVLSDTRSGFIVKHLICPQLKEHESQLLIPTADVSNLATFVAMPSQQPATPEMPEEPNIVGSPQP